MERCLIGGPAAGLATFWQTLHDAKEPWVIDHPLLAAPEARQTAIPIFLHADEVKYYNKNEHHCYVFSISSLARGAAPATKLLIAALPVIDFCEDTLWEFLDWLVFDLECLQQGKFPSVGWRGRALDKRRVALGGKPIPVHCVIAGVKGDGKWLQQAYKWPRSFNHNAICRSCLASRVAGPLLWTDFTSSATWQASDSPAPSQSPLTRLTGAHASSIFDDMFHILWVHGVGNDLVGSTLCLLARVSYFSEVVPGGGRCLAQQCSAKVLLPHKALVSLTDLESAEILSGDEGDDELTPPDLGVEEQFRLGYLQFREWCRKNKIETTQELLTSKTVHCTARTQSPQLTGKGCDVRLVLLWLQSTLSEKPPQARHQALSPVSLEMVCRVVHLLAWIVQGIASEPTLLAPTTSASLSKAGRTFVIMYVHLAGDAVRSGSTLYKVRPKTHVWWHLMSRLRALNPKVVSCMADESFMGVVAAVASQCHRLSMNRRVLMRYLHQLGRHLREGTLLVFKRRCRLSWFTNGSFDLILKTPFVVGQVPLSQYMSRVHERLHVQIEVL